MSHLGVLAPVTGGFFFGEVLSGFVREVAAAGGRVTLVQTLDAGLSGDDVVPAPDVTVPVGLAHIDGYAAIAQASSGSFLRRLREAGKPVVLMSNALDDLDAASVVADNVGGVRAAVDHLVEHGHSRIAFVGNLTQTDMTERYGGYREAMIEHGLVPAFFPAIDHVERGGAGAVRALLTARPAITAVVTSTDRAAIGLMRALAEHRLRVPRDVAVIGFDNLQNGWHTTPPLSTVDQQSAEIGAHGARLLLAELAGEQVEHRRHTVAATLVPRASCGCGVSAAVATSPAEENGQALVAEIGRHLGLRLQVPTSRPHDGVDPARVDLAALDAVIRTTLHRLYPVAPSPETLSRFSWSVMNRLGQASDGLTAAGLPGAEVLRHCMAQLTVLAAHLQARSGLTRAEHLSVSLREQYDVGMSLLARVEFDPSDLRWLDHVGVRLGCLGLWDGPPERGVLRISGVYDPANTLRDTVDPTCPVEDFPPRPIVERAHAEAEEVSFVVPVRGASGNHGYLCVVGPVDTHSGTGRATYNYWAALLGVALKQQRLLETVRQSEERYSLITRATHDGLWDWDVVAGRCYYSQHCQEMLGADLDDDVGAGEDTQNTLELAPWMDRIHPEDLPLVREALHHAVVSQEPFELEHRVLVEDGSYRWMLCRARTVGPPGKAARRVVGALSDVHERKRLNEQLRQAALYDAVTGLPNRRLFLDRLAWAVEQAQRPNGARFAVVFLDLDGFKLINDSLGHMMGDQLLLEVGQRLRGDLRSADTAARFGGDEFALLLYGLGQDAVLSVVTRLQERIAIPVMLAGHEVSVTASIGIAISETGYTEAEDVLRDADIAMYHAKESERGTARVFDPVMHTRATNRLRAQSELRAALAGEQFVVHYQPVVALDGSALTSLEALVRWEHPERGLLLPGDFLPIMAETGTIVVLGQWILDTVCAQVAAWREAYRGPLTIAVNLSHREFWSDQLLPAVTRALDRHGVPPSCLVLEITESVIMADPEAARQVMTALHANGVRMHIDDFGTGQSSLHALRAFPVDALKIDQSFVQQIDVDHQTTELVRIIVGMGRTLGLEVAAEGVETLEQAEQLRTMGCGTVQGWLYAKAVPGDEAGRLLGRQLEATADVDQPA